jgi:hypothetical protein
LNLLRHFLVADLELLLPRDRGQQHLASQRPLDVRPVTRLQLLAERTLDLAAAGRFVDHALQHVLHEPFGQLEAVLLDQRLRDRRLRLALHPHALFAFEVETDP